MSQGSAKHLRLILGLAATALLLGLWFGSALLQRPVQPLTPSAATLLPEPRPLQAFQLTDSTGGPFTNDSLQGHWTLLSFGYTHCPDVCPTTLAMLEGVQRRLPADAPQVVFVSVDPERDTPSRLARYVQYFNPEFLGATGDHEALKGLTQPLGILYQRVEDQNSALGYLVDHSAQIVLVDPQTRLHALFSPPHDPDKIAGDLQQIRAAYTDDGH